MGITYLCVVLGDLDWSWELGQDGIMVLFAKNSGCFVQSDLWEFMEMTVMWAVIGKGYPHNGGALVRCKVQGRCGQKSGMC